MSKYVCGETITSLDEFARQSVVYVKPWRKAKNMGFLGSMQFRTVQNFIKRGDFATAVTTDPAGVKIN